MPIIPYYEETGMNVGNPQSIGSSSEARLMGEAVEGFGKALADTALVMEKQAKAVRDEQDAQEARAALGLVKIQRQAYRENERVTGTMEDPTGLTTVRNINDKMKPVIDDIVATTITSPRAKRMFQASLPEVMADMMASEIEVGVKGNTTRVKGLYDLAMGQLAAQAADSPEDLNKSLNQATLNIEQSTLIADANKDVEIRSQHKSIIYAVADRMRQNRDFAGARKVVETYASVLGPEDAAKYAQQIDDSRIKEENYQWDQNRRKRTLLEEKREDTRNKKMGELFSEADAALGDPVKLLGIQEKFETLRKADPLTFNSDTVKEFNVFAKSGGVQTELKDEQFESVIFRKWIGPGRGKTLDFKGAMEAINKGKASMAKKNELYGMLRDVQDGINKDPVAGALLQEALKNVRANAGKDITQAQSTLQPYLKEGSESRAAMDFLRRLNGKITVDSINSAIKGYTASGGGITFAPNAPLTAPGSQRNFKTTTDSIRKAAKDLAIARKNKAPAHIQKALENNLRRLGAIQKDQRQGEGR